MMFMEQLPRTNPRSINKKMEIKTTAFEMSLKCLLVS